LYASRSLAFIQAVDENCENWGQTPGQTPVSSLFGSPLVFPCTRADREASGDPRRAIDERSPSKEDYLARVRAAAETLVRDRSLLAEDVEPVRRGRPEVECVSRDFEEVRDEG